MHPVGDVESKFYDLEDMAPVIEDRIIGSLDEDAFTILAKPHELSGRKSASPELVPEAAIILGLGIGLLAEHRMMFADDFFRRVTECGQEILIGAEDFSVGCKFDHGLRPGKRRQLAIILGALALDRCDVGRDLNDLVGLAETKNRIVGGLDPDIVAVLCAAPVLALIILAARQFCPEGLVFC